MYTHDIDPVLLNLGPFEVRYYGIVYAIGFLAALYVLLQASKRHEIRNLDEEKVYDYVLYLILGSILGARLIFEFVYNLQSFIHNPLQFFYVWQGGMSFHGGMIGASLATLYFCKKNKIRFYEIADLLVIVLALMLGFGRIANFLNGELWGKVTNVPWAVQFPGAEGFRHPSQLYESAKNFLIFGILFYMKGLKLIRGVLFWAFVGLYGLLRFLVTFYREAEYYFLGIGIGQWLSLAMVPLAIVMIQKIIR